MLDENEELELLRLKKQKAMASQGSSELMPKEPTARQKAGASLYGLGTGIVGGLGELEKFGAYTVPEYFGAEPKKQTFLGRETVFPTIEEVERGLGKVGIKRPEGELEPYRFGGEISPALLAGGAGLYKLGKFGFGGAVDLLRGGRVRRQAEKLGEEARRAEAAGQKGITAAEVEQQKRLAAETTRGEQAAQVAEKSEAAGGRALRELAGVKTLPEAGSFRPIPETPTNIGNYIRDQANKFVDAIKSQRSAAADANFAAAKTIASQKEAAGQLVNTQPLLNKIDSLLSKGGTTDYLRSLQQLRQDVARTNNFEGLEVIRRKLGDAGFGLPEEGYKAINQKLAKDFYSDLSGAMKEFNEGFSKYLDDYKRLSQNLEAYSTKVGKSLVETVDPSGKYYAKTAEQVAKDVFSSPEKFEQFVAAVGGNRQIAEAAARRYFAGQLERATSVDQVKNFLRDNRALLDNMKGLRQEIESKYLSRLATSEKRVAAAGKVSEEVKIATKDIQKRLLGLPGVREVFTDAVEALASAKPGKAIETFDNTVLPKIRDAEAKSGRKLISDQQIETLRQQAAELERISDKTQKARVAAGLVGTYLVGQSASSAVGRIGGQ
jgi:hypothetical protein